MVSIRLFRLDMGAGEASCLSAPDILVLFSGRPMTDPRYTARPEGKALS